MTSAKSGKNLRVVVAGAGEGIGFVCASAFAARGAEVILTDHDPEALTRAADFLGAYSRFCDVLSETSADIFADEVERDFGCFDVLVNAAGNGFVRTLGMVRMSEALLPVLRRGSGARLIVNVAPSGDLRPKHQLFAHAGSQSGFHALSDALAGQTRGSSIGVVTIAAESGLDATAERIVGVVRAARPEWVIRPPAARRRA